MTWVKMKSKFPGTCSICKRAIHTGQHIRWNNKSKNTQHAKCFTRKTDAQKAMKANIQNPVLHGFHN